MSPSKKLMLILVVMTLIVTLSYGWLLFGGKNKKITTGNNSVIKNDAIGEVSNQPKSELTESSFTGKIESKPGLPKEAKNDLGGLWNETKTHYLHLDSQDEKLKWRDEKGNEHTITTLKNLTPPLEFFWSPDEGRALIINHNDLYFIGVKEGSRKKVIADFEPTQVLWLTTKVWMSDQTGTIFEANFDRPESLQKLSLKINLDQASFVDQNQVLSYRITESTTQIVLTNTTDMSETVLTEKPDFQIKNMSYSAEKKTAYFQEAGSGKWFELKIESL